MDVGSLNPTLLIGLGLVLVLIVVVSALRQRGSGITTVASVPPSVTTPGAVGDLDEQIRAFLQKNQKIEAIKLVRQRSGLGLKEAKDYVEALEAGQQPVLTTTPASVVAAGDLDGIVRALLQKNQKIEAIKIVRLQKGLGLKEAKDYVDALDG